jgi:8-amino-7-oxononanoate synthase
MAAELRARVRIGAAPAQAAPVAKPASRTFDFSTLPSFQQLELLRRAGQAANVKSPFYQEHEGRAGATSVVGGRQVINFGNFDYLSLGGHPDLAKAGKDAIDRYGTCVSASRLVAGERPIHRALEALLASLHETSDAIVFPAGHATNVSTVSCLLGPRDLVLADALIHNSIAEGIKLSGATRLTFAHNDLASLRNLLVAHRARYENVLIAIEGLYSMDGDYPDLAGFVDLKQRFDAWLMVDEAHSIGVLGAAGRGIAEEQGVDPRDVEIWMGTLSKAMASLGGYIAGSRPLIDILRANAAGFVYATGLSAMHAAIALEAVRVWEREPARREAVRRNADLFASLARAAGLDIGTRLQGSPVVPVIIGDSIGAALMSNRLFDRGVNALPIAFPAVPDKLARLRFFIVADHTSEQIETAVRVTAEELRILQGSSR